MSIIPAEILTPLFLFRERANVLKIGEAAAAAQPWKDGGEFAFLLSKISAANEVLTHGFDVESITEALNKWATGWIYTFCEKPISTTNPLLTPFAGMLKVASKEGMEHYGHVLLHESHMVEGAHEGAKTAFEKVKDLGKSLLNPTQPAGATLPAKTSRLAHGVQ